MSIAQRRRKRTDQHKRLDRDYTLGPENDGVGGKRATSNGHPDAVTAPRFPVFAAPGTITQTGAGGDSSSGRLVCQ